MENGAVELAKTTPITNNQLGAIENLGGGLERSMLTVYFIMLGACMEAVWRRMASWSSRDATDIHFVKMVPRWMDGARLDDARHFLHQDGAMEDNAHHLLHQAGDMQPGGVKLEGMPPRAAEYGDTEPARTTPVAFIIK